MISHIPPLPSYYQQYRAWVLSQVRRDGNENQDPLYEMLNSHTAIGHLLVTVCIKSATFTRPLANCRYAYVSRNQNLDKSLLTAPV